MALIAKSTAEAAEHATNEISDNFGFVANGAGTLEYQARNDTANRTLEVAAGAYYGIDIKIYHTDSDAAIAGLVIYTEVQEI
jgi:hypothetical protein